MKQIIVTALLLVLISVGCKKNEKAITPTTPTPASTAYTSADTAISGNWVLDVTENYNNGTLYLTTPHSDPVNCHLDLQIVESTLTPGNTQSWKNCIHGLNCSNNTYQWRLTSGRLDINTHLYTIVSQSTTNLIILDGSISVGGGYGIKYYLHK